MLGQKTGSGPKWSIKPNPLPPTGNEPPRHEYRPKTSASYSVRLPVEKAADQRQTGDYCAVIDAGARWWCVRTAIEDNGIAQGRAVWKHGANQYGRQEIVTSKPIEGDKTMRSDRTDIGFARPRKET